MFSKISESPNVHIYLDLAQPPLKPSPASLEALPSLIWGPASLEASPASLETQLSLLGGPASPASLETSPASLETSPASFESKPSLLEFLTFKVNFLCQKLSKSGKAVIKQDRLFYNKRKDCSKAGKEVLKQEILPRTTTFTQYFTYDLIPIHYSPGSYGSPNLQSELEWWENLLWKWQ